jgi:hypothetical protein
VKIDELIWKLAAIREERGNCDVFVSLGGRSSEFLVSDAVFVDRHNPEHRPTASQQSWLPARTVIRVRHI